MSNPWGKFFWADWLSDPALRMCSPTSRAIWMDMLCVAAEAKPHGYVKVADKALGADDIARLCGVTVPEAEAAIAELERYRVFSRAGRDRTIYSRRMVRDANKARIARENGKNGGNPTLRKTKGNPPSDKTRLKPQKPEARSQSSSEDKSSGELPFAAPIPLDPDKRAWSDAVALLTERGRMTPAKARAFFGGLLKTHAIPAKDLLGAIGACIASGSQDPASYLAASAKAKGRSPPGGMVRDAGFV